jgi:hypothetical protein
MLSPYKRVACSSDQQSFIYGRSFAVLCDWFRKSQNTRPDDRDTRGKIVPSTASRMYGRQRLDLHFINVAY